VSEKDKGRGYWGGREVRVIPLSTRSESAQTKTCHSELGELSLLRSDGCSRTKNILEKKKEKKTACEVNGPLTVIMNLARPNTGYQGVRVLSPYGNGKNSGVCS